MGLLFEFYLHSVNSEIEIQPARHRYEIHDDAILIPHGRAAGSAPESRPGVETGVIPVEIIQAFKV